MVETAVRISEVRVEERTARADARRRASFIALYFCLGVFINGFTNLPLTFLLKERLHLGRWQLSLFAALSDWAWYVKPAFGALTDRVPIFGRRRLPYLAGMGLLLIAAWGGLALMPGYRLGSLLGALALSALALAFLNTVTAKLLAELSQAEGTSGRLNSMRQFASQAALLAAGPAGGWAAAHWPFQRVALAAAVVAAVLLAGALLLVREPRPESELCRDSLQREAPGALRTALRSRAVWLALGFILLVELSPGFNTPLLFFERDELHFAKELFGQFQMAGALAAIVGAAFYARLCRRWPLSRALPAVIVLHAAATLAWLYLRTPASALAIKALTGFTLSLTSLAIFDLATRAAPRGAEGTVLAVIFAGVNIAAKASDLIGSHLSDQHWSLRALVFLNAGTTCLAAGFVPLLPRPLVARRDGEPGSRPSEVAAVDLHLGRQVLDRDGRRRVGAGDDGVEMDRGSTVLRERAG